MKNRILAMIVMLFASGSLFAQADRNTIRDLMRFYYVADINSDTYTPGLLDNAAIMAGTETGAFWTNANMRGPQQLVRNLLKANGDANMQSIAAKILRLLNKPVRVNLLDDSRNSVDAVTRRKYGACVGDGGKAWPCASNMTTSNDFEANCARILGVTAPARSDNLWAGNVCMGTAYFSAAGGMTFKMSTILHELVHTQDYSDGRGHLFWVDTINYRYGADGTHYGTEAIPNRAMTYKEGIANAIRLMYDVPRLQEMWRWFTTDGAMRVEQVLPAPGTAPAGSISRCAEASAPSPDVWLYNQLRTAGITPVGHQGGYGLFRLRSLPARFIAHNEYILAMIGEEYVQHVSMNKFFAAIRAVNSQALRTSSSAYAQLFLALCQQALPAGATVESVSTSSTTTQPMPYLFPLALVDYFTGYRSTTLAQFRDIFENQGYMEPWTQLYWTNAKDVVRTRVPMNNLNFGNLTDIAIALGINSSTPD